MVLKLEFAGRSYGLALLYSFHFEKTSTTFTHHFHFYYYHCQNIQSWRFIVNYQHYEKKSLPSQQKKSNAIPDEMQKTIFSWYFGNNLQ